MQEQQVYVLAVSVLYCSNINHPSVGLSSQLSGSSIIFSVLIWSLESVLDTISGYEWGWGLLGKVKKYDPVSAGVWGLVNSLVSAMDIFYSICAPPKKRKKEKKVRVPAQVS